MNAVRPTLKIQFIKGKRTKLYILCFTFTNELLSQYCHETNLVIVKENIKKVHNKYKENTQILLTRGWSRFMILE